jgi:hypothetical protein
MSKILNLNERVAVTYTITVPVRTRGKESIFREQTFEGTLVARRRETRAAIREDIARIIARLEDSPVEVRASFKTDPIYKVDSFMVVKGKKQNKAAIKMKGVTLDLDGELPNSWDMRKGTCVFDWLRHRYGDKKGCVKVIKALDDLWPTGREGGVSTLDLRLFAEKVGIYMYALDEDDAFIEVYKPKVLSHSLPALCFRVKNQHMYPIVDHRVRCYAKRYQALDSEVLKKKEKTVETTPEIKEIIVLDSEGGSREALMVKTMQEVGVEVFPARKIRSVDDSISSFILKDNLYVFKDDTMLAAARDIYTSLGRPWKGESIINLLGEVLDKHKPNLRGPVSAPMLESLTDPIVKNRAHYGWISETQEGDWAFDINRCYGYVIENPLEPWMCIQLQDDWRPYAWAPVLPLGLYFVETADMTLMHGTNIYSSAMVMKARAEGIVHKVHSQCIASVEKPMNLFAPILEDIRAMCGGNAKWEKMLVNAMIGTFGQDHYRNRRVRINTDKETVFNDMVGMIGQNEFVKKHDDMYVYGSVRTNKMLDSAAGAWIQVLDQSNIRLYDFIKKTGGILIGRKTDCAVIRGGSLDFGTRIGDPRPDVVPEMTEMKERAVALTLTEPKVWNKLDFFSSNQDEEIYQAFLKNNGLMVEGRAGTGKSRVGLYICRRYAEDFSGSRILRGSFTNKAALNIDGETLHQILHIDGEGKIDIKYLEGVAMLWIDEISTIAGSMWNNIQAVKARYPQMLILLSGDYRQCPPIEDIKVDWFNSDLVRSICSNTQVELTERQRYDAKLWDLAEDVYEKNILGIAPKKYGVEVYSQFQNICYLNETRGVINKTANDYMRSVKIGREIGDRFVYVGMPVIADATSKNNYANNESFVVDDLGTPLSLTSMRQGKKHTIKIDDEEFLGKFSMAYCITTHKLQGDTIDNPVYIWDSKRMNRNILYTAVTRVKKMSQIHISAGTPDLHA